MHHGRIGLAISDAPPVHHGHAYRQRGMGFDLDVDELALEQFRTQQIGNHGGVVEWPAGIKPRVSNFPSGTVDMFPTLIDIAGLSPDAINKVHDGISLAEVFKTEPTRRDQPIGFRANGGWMWLDNDWKIVKNADYIGGEEYPYELYNVIGDPSEEQNLIDTYPEISERLYRQFKQWSLSVSRSALGADYPEGRVLPTGREGDPKIDERRAMRVKKWAEEVRAAESSK